ncbi:glutathione S-transferase [Coccomyxa subellipsoidea C-169]|uniref:Glutathione S-transferase n=1 Tax=Coccomyxa subellipsoidea (strain C-169) TaxID=574566 RepID=I0YNY0_COCSC|nr:glutathione S-transferase [Coccomyxa subellipsoidea C-169]EIE20099.1 glutathione S-transferase [Coccomyxa subellipsoidea C-169]|eukprot:XP_005644643.1 glutathione S-transferase [Coccomyxa subellipsoidea C-169]
MADEEFLELNTELTLLCSWFCPFAQRTWIALLEKGLPFAYKEVSLRNPDTGLWYPLTEKPKWFTALNPLGKVPVLAYKDEKTQQPHSVYESLICNEFLEDYAPAPGHPPLLPPHPALRAKARIVMDHFNTRFVPLFYRILIRQDVGQQAEVAEQLQAECDWLEDNADQAGPFFMGTEFSLVDCAMIPWFVRGYILKHFRQLELPPQRCTKLQRWVKAALERPSVKGTFQAPEEGTSYEDKLLEHYVRYADGSANSTSAAAFK